MQTFYIDAGIDGFQNIRIQNKAKERKEKN